MRAHVGLVNFSLGDILLGLPNGGLILLVGWVKSNASHVRIYDSIVLWALSDVASTFLPWSVTVDTYCYCHFLWSPLFGLELGFLQWLVF